MIVENWVVRKLDLPKTAAERLFTDFELRLAQTAADTHPNDIDILTWLGTLYTRQDRDLEALAVDRKAVTVAPNNPIAYYNLVVRILFSLEVDLEPEYEKLLAEFPFAS